MYSWFDIMMHFLGGLFVALSALWFFFESGYIHLHKSIKNVVLVAVGSIILIGVSWEVFELLAGVPIENNFALDTTIDAIMDGLGAALAAFIFIKIYIKDNIENEYGE
jgi:hypothetical protein